ncbi:hypothetical protein Acr_00g0076630 [Actinidia rufa]|uniref:Uncharacterized protein n=1 Tax=Actinidia rufa TaxID=165716 RepID=A0A7J0DVF6_9ERIC|nr:hypothetical protein Acr_00g0076630 [Actinidia rufa]
MILFSDLFPYFRSDSTAISLYDYPVLRGTLPEEIGNLNLEKLSIHEASLTGLIPFQIFNMSTIRIIDLGFNQLSGQLPLSLGLWLPNLELLYLGDNKLSGIIPSSIGNASKLTILSVTTNSFSGSIPNTVGNLRFLRLFLASQNNLTRESSSLELSFFYFPSKLQTFGNIGDSIKPI